MKLAATLTLVLGISGCANLQARYCSPDSETYRAFLITLVKMNLPIYPKEGVCKYVRKSE